MSVVVLLRDHPRFGKKGQRVDRVPFADANDLVRDGFAVRPGASALAAAPATVPAEALEAAGKRIAELEKANAKLTDEADDLRADVAKAADKLAKVEAENKKLADDLAGLRAATAKAK